MKSFVFLRLNLFILLIISFGRISFSQQFTNEEYKIIENYCQTKNGITEIVNMIESKNNKDLRFSADAFGITYEEQLWNTAVNICNNLTGKSSSYYFDYDENTKTFFFGDIWCKAGWNDECTHSLEYKLPAGWQVCSLDYSISKNSGGKNKVEFEPILWYTNDTENPPRFRGYRVKIYGEGSKRLLRQKDGHIKVENIKIHAILTQLNNKDRYKYTCFMPERKVKEKNIETELSATIIESSDKKVIYNFTSARCNYDIYYLDTSNGVVNCKGYTKIGTVNSRNQISVEILPGKSALIAVTRGTNPCVNKKQFYEVVVPPNLKKNLINNYELHDFYCE